MSIREDARAKVPGFAARVEALKPFTVNGPNYRRRVRDELQAAHHGWDADQVGARLVTAEIAAGFRHEDDYLTRFEAGTWSTIPTTEATS